MFILIIKSLVFTIIVPGIISVLIPLSLSEGVIADNTGFVLLGILFLISGLSIYSWCVWDFVTFGKGTPAPIDAPKHLVVRGLYHYSRNPMYVGVLFVIAGWTLFFTNLTILLYGVCVMACLQLLIVFYEEPKLHQIFNQEYTKYKNKINRWLPKLL